ncbi:MAG: hypothetical protein GKR96_03500 [Gammaproteobacteria bacterium]|nr:hypothetical protein [Gammaproteobacteria bacterium]
MNYLNRQRLDLGADSQDDAQVSTQALELKSRQIQQQIDALSLGNIRDRALLSHDLANVQIDCGHTQLAWKNALPAFQFHIDRQEWELATVVCDTLFHCDHQDSLIALGHGLWLSITFPVEPTLTISQLQHVIDETPEDSDGAAVAAAVAAYVVELRGNQVKNDDAALIIGQILNDVARRHSNVQSPEEFDQWFKRLELNVPEKLLVRMRNIIDVLVQDQWWIDRAELQAMIPADNES